MSDVNDAKRFLVHRWTLLQIDYATPIKLVKVFRDRYGVAPDFDSTVTGTHFFDASSRAVLFDEGARARATPELVAQVLSLISSMYRSEARLVERDTARRLPRERLPAPHDEELVEIWPPPPVASSAIVAEFVSAAGWFAAPGIGADAYVPTADPNEALVFDTLEDAEAFLAAVGQARFVLRFLATARAEFEQREASIFNGY